MYEAADLDVVTFTEYLERLNSPTPGRENAPILSNTSRAVCQIVCSTGSSAAATACHAIGRSRRAKRSDVSASWRRCVSARHGADGVVACHLYAADQAASHLTTAESSSREFDVPSWVVLAEATTFHAAQQVRMLIDGPELQHLGVIVRSDAAIYSLEICRLASPSRELAARRK